MTEILNSYISHTQLPNKVTSYQNYGLFLERR